MGRSVTGSFLNARLQASVVLVEQPKLIPVDTWGLTMDMNLAGRNILIVQGSLIAGAELKDAFTRSKAQVYITGNLISAFHLLERKAFHGAVVDQDLHNEAFDVCAELQAR